MENIEEWLEDLKRSDKIIIVEGPNDKKALEYFGINNIVTLSRKPIFQIVEDISMIAHQVIILTDFDKKGKELYGKLSSALQRHGVQIDNKFREYLLRTRLSHIEGLVKFTSSQENYRPK